MDRSIYLRLSKILGLFSVARWVTRNRLRILGYHGIWFSDGHYGNYLFMSPDKFQSRMEWLKNSDYPVISLERAVDDLSRSKLSHCSTVITIDDGWYGTYLHMLPVFEKYALPATLYVFTGAVDSQKALPNILLPALIQLTRKMTLNITGTDCYNGLDYDLSSHLAKQESTAKILDVFWGLKEDAVEAFCRCVTSELGFDYDEIISTRQFSFINYEEISDANRRGLDIQLHTDSHRLNPKFPAAIGNEIVINRNKLRPHVNSSLKHFCFPGGIHSTEMYGYLEINGVKSATLVDTGLAVPESNKYELKRILDGQDVSQLEFEAEMSGFLELVRESHKTITAWLHPHTAIHRHE